MFKAYASNAAGEEFKSFEYDPGDLQSNQVEIDVISCGLCHSDYSMWQNHWGITSYPFVAGHEVIGKIAALGDNVPELKVGDTVGLGWFSESCNTCNECRGGDLNLCSKEPEQTIIGRHGGFANKVRCHWSWATPLPEGIDLVKAGPLFCGGITVFNPIVQLGINPTDKVGVIGIGGLGHLALQFLNKWGCEVTAFSSNESKREEALNLGAHHVVNSRDSKELAKIQGSLDFIICTANVDLDWSAFFACLGARGKLHFVGVVPKPISVEVFPMISSQKSVSGSPLGSPATTNDMLEFCARHNIAAMVETFPMSKVNEAMEHLHSGKARYRIVLENDI